jgi:hypothetical protein
MKKQTPTPDPDMLEEYDFSKGVRGKYVKRFKDGNNIWTEKADQDENQAKNNGKVISFAEN